MKQKQNSNASFTVKVYADKAFSSNLYYVMLDDIQKIDPLAYGLKSSGSKPN